MSAPLPPRRRPGRCSAKAAISSWPRQSTAAEPSSPWSIRGSITNIRTGASCPQSMTISPRERNSSAGYWSRRRGQSQSLPALCNLDLHRTDEPCAHEPRWILRRAGPKRPRLAQSHAVEERVGHRHFQHVFARAHEIRNFDAIGPQQQRGNPPAVDSDLGDISYDAKIENLPGTRIGRTDREVCFVNPAPGETAQFAVERPVDQFRQIAAKNGALAGLDEAGSRELPAAGNLFGARCAFRKQFRHRQRRTCWIEDNQR